MSQPGLVILLNGTSSAGKTSIALALLAHTPDPSAFWSLKAAPAQL